MKLYLPYKQIEITGWFLQENVLFSKIFLIIKIVCQMKEFLENIFFLISHSYSNYSVGLELQDWQSKNKTRTNKWYLFPFFFFFFAILIFFKLVSQEQDDPIANLTNQNYLLKACYLVFPCLYYMLHPWVIVLKV